MYDNEQSVMSKFLCMILRHHPELLDLKMDKAGWVEVDELLYKLNQERSCHVYLSNLQYIVKSDNKQRFEIKKEDGKSYIRAQYGHSIRGIDLGYEEIEPPAILYHGTATKNLESIRSHGLLPMGRQYVHLSEDKKNAKNTGARHGTPVVLKVRAKDLYNKGVAFYKAPNGVWLTQFVENEFVSEDTV